jgi:hypothetical protein
MQFRSVLVLLVAVTAVPACKKKDKNDSAGSAGSAVGSAEVAGSAAAPTPPPAGAGTPFEATLEGKPFKFTNAKISDAAGADRITLSTGALACDADPTSGDTTLTVDVGQGPGGKHFAPGPFGVDIELYNEKQEFAIGNTLRGVLTLEPGEWKAGNKIKGTLRFEDAKDDKKYSGKGSFEAVVCDFGEREVSYPPTPETADAGPVSGTLGGEKFTVKTAVANLRHDDALNVDYIDNITLSDAEINCNKSINGMMVNFGARAMGKDVFTGTPLPTRVGWFKGGTNYGLKGSGWVKYDTIELKEGGEVKGSLFAEAAGSYAKDPKMAAKVSGTFTAKVCK